MLPLRKHWHNAFQPAPEREARLLWFANANTDAAPDLTPGPENTSSTEGHTAAGEAVNDQAGKTKGAIKDALNEKDAEGKKDQNQQALEVSQMQEKEVMRKKFSDLIEKARANATKLHELRLRMQNKKILEKLKLHGNKGLLERWNNDIQLVIQEDMNSIRELEFAEALSTLWEGELAPKKFLNRYGDYLQTLPYGFNNVGEQVVEGTLRDYIDSGADNIPALTYDEETWATTNESDRLEATDRLLKHIGLNEWMSSKTEQYNRMEKALKQQEAHVESVEKQATLIDTAEEANQMTSRGLIGAIKLIRWYSINDYITGVGKYWNALKSTWETRSERLGAQVARNIGTAMKPFDIFPIYGKEVDTILGQQLDAKDSEEEEAMKKLLEDNHATWEKVFAKDSGEFWQWKGKNANKARGCLAWAAEHGYLYDIDENLDDHDHPIYGVNIADICYDWAGDDSKIRNYFTNLRGKNSSGREHGIDHGYKMEFDVENVPRFIRLIEHEMDEHNLWAAAGVCKRAMERGLRGEVAAWCFTTIMSKLREHRELQKVTPVAFFDIVGKLSMYNTAFTLGWMKGLRPQLKLWAVSGDDTLLDKTPLKHFNTVENDILAKDPSIDPHTEKGRQRLNELVAKVFACQIIDLPGGNIHIFETRFDSYRKAATGMFAATADPTKEDSDFAIEDTEKAMLPDVVVKKILKYNSTYEFSVEDWVQPYLGSLIGMANSLGASSDPALKDAHKNYCDEIRARMDLHFGSYKKDDRAVKQLSTMDTKTGKPAIASLIAADLLSWKLLQNAAYADVLADQLNQYFPEKGPWVAAPKTPKK